MASPESHALLSASGSHRWLACPPSVRLTEHIQTGTSQFAEEGRIAHAYSEHILGLFIGTVTDKRVPAFIRNSQYFNDEMKSFIAEYTDKIIEEYNAALSVDRDAKLLLEQKYSYTDYVPSGFGTADVTIITNKKLIVMDLKYGKGVPVDAVGNPQIRLYGLGAYQSFGMLYDFEEVELHILQPRLESYSSECLYLDELLDWGESIKPIAMQAYRGEGEFQSGEHCRWCPVKATCRHRYEENIELAKYDFCSSDTLSIQEIGDILARVKRLEAWSKDVQEYAFSLAKKGTDIPGWKLVAGRSSRFIPDESLPAFEEELRMLFRKEELEKTSRKSMSEIEKMLGKKDFGILFNDYVKISEGKPTLVPEADKRPAISGTQAAVNDFL